MISPILSRAGTAVTNATRYIGIASNQFYGYATAASSAQQPMPCSGTLTRLGVRFLTAPGTGASWTVSLLKNGIFVSDTLSVVVSGIATTSIDLINSVSYVRGDQLCLMVVPSAGTAPAGAAMIWSLLNDSDNQPVISGDQGSITTTSYLAWQTGATQAAAPNPAGIVPTAGVIKNAYFWTVNSPAVGTSWTLTLVKNGVDTSLVCGPITNPANLAEDTNSAHAVSVVAGDEVYWRVDASGAPGSTRIHISSEFVPTIDGESVQTGFSGTGVTSGAATGVGTNTSASATENVRYVGLYDSFDFKKLRVKLASAIGASASATFTLRIGLTTDTALAATAATGTSTASESVKVVSWTESGIVVYVGIWQTRTGTPSMLYSWGFVTYREPIRQSAFFQST